MADWLNGPRAVRCWLWLSLDCASAWAGYLPGPHAKAAKPTSATTHRGLLSDKIQNEN